MHWALNLKKFRRGFILGIMLIVGLVLLIQTGAMAVPIQNLANGHYYELIRQTVTWEDANTDAQNRTHNGWTGHLVTLTSQEENDWVYTNIADGAERAWLGGFQNVNSQDYSEASGGWEWVTGESWNYTNWAANEPNNSGDTPENALSYIPLGDWNDVPEDMNYEYIVEYEPTDEGNTVPEPLTMMLFGSGLAGLAVMRRKRA